MKKKYRKIFLNVVDVFFYFLLFSQRFSIFFQLKL